MSTKEGGEIAAATAAAQKMEIDDDDAGTNDDPSPPALHANSNAPSTAADTVMHDAAVTAAADTTSSTDSDDDGPISLPDLSDDDAASLSDKATPPQINVEETLIQATLHKEQGNQHFAANELDKAVREYRRGVNVLKKINRRNTGDEQTKALLVTLQTNMSMVYYKQQKYHKSRDVAAAALTVQSTHVKALYRRAVAYRQLGDAELARDDLKQAVALDPANTACKKQLVAVRQAIEKAKQQQKEALSKAFSGKSTLLYNDKAAAEARKAEAEKARKQQEQERYKQRKQEWEDECVHRMAQNEAAITFEDWEKEQKAAETARQDAEEKARKEAEAHRKAEQKARRAAERAARKAANNNDDDDGSELDLTEQELAQMRGYKKTKDGRTTSYFTREIPDHEKQHIAHVAPQRLDDGTTTTSWSTAPPARSIVSANSSSGSTTASAWNQAGTWEERNTTEWCTTSLRQHLRQTSTSGMPTTNADDLTAHITKVEELTGDASVALTGGKKRYIFDYHAKLKYEIQRPQDQKWSDDEKSGKVASGTVRLPDICSTHHEELEVTFAAWKMAPAEALHEGALHARTALAEQLRWQVQQWVQAFNAQY